MIATSPAYHDYPPQWLLQNFPDTTVEGFPASSARPSWSRRRCAPDQSSINPAPDPVFAGIGNFRPHERLRARDHSSLNSLLEEVGFEPSVPRDTIKTSRGLLS